MPTRMKSKMKLRTRRTSNPFFMYFCGDRLLKASAKAACLRNSLLLGHQGDVALIENLD